jgi:hypothetical protein
MSYDEIAETMGMSLEAVKSVLFRAKENLKQALSKSPAGRPNFSDRGRVVYGLAAVLTRRRMATIRGPMSLSPLYSLMPWPAAPGKPAKERSQGRPLGAGARGVQHPHPEEL